MVEYRYRDKVYLSSYMLDTRLFDMFDIIVEEATPIRSIYILKTDDGLKILKKVDYSEDELTFIYNSLNEIRKTYPYVINYKKSISGKPFVEYEGGRYVIIDLIEGRECMYENPLDLKNAAIALAKLHKAGEKLNVNYYPKNKLGIIIEEFRKRAEIMQKFREIALMHRNKNDFDKIYLEYSDYYIMNIIDAAVHLEKSKYKEFCKEKGTLCHHDLAHHNILIGNDENVYFVDFDYSIIDLPYHDISNMITKAVKYNGWSMDNANIIINSYMEEKKLSKDELEVLYGYLMFPQDFYDISTSYYMRTRDWDDADFVNKLQRKAGYKDEREEFLKNFKKSG
ncbi:spore coat protein [Fervidicella metallireducens AeB]|uniref:Spore coat protein n=1 Tax=Fervidicella metallireducens AeB TaxID=1403537 RepID=A0A017RYM3_9CLOT|nr:spore coat protein [Fervidicella metallireducens AeB]